MFKVGNVITHADYKDMKFVILTVNYNVSGTLSWLGVIDLKNPKDHYSFYHFSLVKLVPGCLRYLNKEAVCTE